ncbi:MAG TPA: MerR family transcriptional regulator [Candidatus Angelobacter sp.]|nr:MerR family transcriptional regulator [Candidatus Angelobacter sp.]
MYRVREFAEKAGVTVRTLHHYDRLGLLKPSGRTDAGYRLYGERDLVRLQQIVTLKFIGMPLREIKDLLDQADLDLAATLRLQRQLLQEKRRQMATAIQAIDQAERSMQSTGRPDWVSLKKIIEVLEMQNNMEWSKKYYSEEAQAKIEERGTNWTPELQAQVTQDWKELLKEVEAALSRGEDPSGPKGRELAQRWSKLVGGFTAGDPEIQRGLNRMYADQANWPAHTQTFFSDFPQLLNAEVQSFIKKAMEARKAWGDR